MLVEDESIAYLRVPWRTHSAILQSGPKSIDLATLVYDLTATYPRHEIYGLTSQMRRSSVSVASNIAEGSARGTTKDFRQFIEMAQGSNAERQTQLVISRRLGFGSEDTSERASALSREIGRMLSGLSTYLQNRIRKESTKPNN
jgi:four helix bundle protein